MWRLLTCVILLGLPSMAEAQLARLCSQGSLQVTSIRRAAPANNVPGTDYFASLIYSGPASLTATITYKGGLADKRPITVTFQPSLAQEVRLGRLTPGSPRLSDHLAATEVTVGGC
jgi:hypothetical protein